MFVLTELWLITYIRDVGTKGKQVPDACWNVGVLLGQALEGVGMECHRYAMLLLIRFKNYEICYF